VHNTCQQLSVSYSIAMCFDIDTSSSMSYASLRLKLQINNKIGTDKQVVITKN